MYQLVETRMQVLSSFMLSPLTNEATASCLHEAIMDNYAYIQNVLEADNAKFEIAYGRCEKRWLVIRIIDDQHIIRLRK